MIRRNFLECSVKALAFSVAVTIIPSIVPAGVLGRNARVNRINVGAIGTGRISRIQDMPGLWARDFFRIVCA